MVWSRDRLDKQLHPRRLRRVPTEALGNWLFCVVAQSCKVGFTHKWVESEVCKYLRANRGAFEGSVVLSDRVPSYAGYLDYRPGFAGMFLLQHYVNAGVVHPS